MTTSYFSHTTISRLVSKKFFAFLFLVVVCTVMLALDKLSSDLFSNIIQLIAPIYLGADVVQNSVISHTEKKHARLLNELANKGVKVVKNDTASIKPELNEVKTIHEPEEIKSSMAHIDNNGITIKPSDSELDTIDFSVSKDDEKFDPVKHRMRLFPANS